jgi:hypothetical protein
MSHHASDPDFGFPRGDARLDMTDLYAFPKPGDHAKSILVFNAHPSFSVNPPGHETTEPFAPGALYEMKIDTDGDAIADISYSVRFRSCDDGKQTATLRRVQGVRAAGACDEGATIVEGAPVSVGQEALVTRAGECRFFFGWRSDPFFFDANGFFDKMQFTGDDFFTDKNVCSIVLELPNSALGTSKWDFGLAQWTKLLKVGSRQTAVGARCKLSSSLESGGRRTSPGSRRMMIGSLAFSRTNWNTQAPIRRRMQGPWPRDYCQTFFITTLAARCPFPRTAEHSSTM